MALIDLSNYASTLHQSSISRSGTPNGNCYFNKSTGAIEFISATEAATYTPIAATAATTISTASSDQVTRATGSFWADGWRPGMRFTLANHGTDDGTYTIEAISANGQAITTVETSISGAAGSGDETLAGAVTTNALIEVDGLKFEGIYAFENQERAYDEDLRKYDRWTSGTFKFGGAYNFINSRKPSTTADRSIIRGSGWNEIASDGGIDRIYFGNKGLSNIEATSQPYYQLSIGGAPVNYAKQGQIDEAVQVYGSTANTPSDAGAGNFDTRTYEAVSVRTFGYNYDRKETTTDLGIAELGGYSTGFAVNETPHLTTGNYTLADVYGGSQISPWTGMTLEKLASPQTETGFNEADGDFTWVLNNTVPGNLDQCVAFLDALAQTDDDIDSGAITVTNGKRVGTWYSYDAQGRIVTNAPFSGEGLFLENIPTADEQRVVFTDDSGNTKTRPFVVSVEATVGATAKADANAWYHSFFAANYNTAGAVTVQDSGASEVKGFASTANGSNVISFAFDYDGDTVGGTAGTNKNCVFLCEGDGGATQAKTLYTITRQTTVAFACAPGVENNA